MKKVLLTLLVLAMICAAGTAALAADPAPAERSETRPYNVSQLVAGASETYESLFVDVEWLKKHLNEVIVIDTRPESLYVGGHIQGAVNATWTYFANINAPAGSMKWGVLWPEATMAKRIGALGINGKKHVVLYCDGGGWGQSGYAAMIMRMCGIKDAKILDGGILAWKKAGGKISTTKHTNKAVAFSLTKYAPYYVTHTQWINDNIGKPSLVLLDVRTPQEFEGKIRPFQEKRGGHLPGAINLPMGELIDKDFKFMSHDELKAIFQKAGLTPDTEIVVYDTAGVRAANVLMALRYTGFPKSRCYDEGYQAWAGDATLEIETSN
ncbi:sulfurtransferase [Synergistaceae bacterium OttesenSCG-928-D05]|nr:sulfurtransferase [Synergistaceae bacterium OttesenSCG-928-D05]